MLKFSKKLDYTLSAMVHLAKADAPQNARQVAVDLNLPQPLTANLLKELVGGGILKSYRGAQGGYSLGKNPADVNIQQIIELIDGPLKITDCAFGDTGCLAYEACFAKYTINFLQAQIVRLFSNITLLDMMQASLKADYFLENNSFLNLEDGKIIKRT